MMQDLTVAKVINLIEELYPLRQAESWDRNGLIAGDRSWTVKKILLSLDPTFTVTNQAVREGYDLIVTHHPLFLTPVSFLELSNPKAKLVYELNLAKIALYNLHTNADVSPTGVGKSLADAIGLLNQEVLVPAVEDTGHGIIGTVAEVELEVLLRDLSTRLPRCPHGLLVSGSLKRNVTKVAVSPGSGISFLSQAIAKGAQVFLTSDVKYHYALDNFEDDRITIVSASHFVTEVLWLETLKKQLIASLGSYPIEVSISHTQTNPWVMHLETMGENPYTQS